LLLKTLQSLKADEMLFFIDELGPLQVRRYGGRCCTPKKHTPTLSFSEMINHAGQDADMTLRPYPVLIEQLKERGIAGQYFGHTVPLIARLGDMEFRGIAANERQIDRITDSLIKKAAHLKREQALEYAVRWLIRF